LRGRQYLPNERFKKPCLYTEIPYNKLMKTVIETPTFQKQVDKIWSEDERLAFITWIADNPLAGDVIPGAEGARKVRWTMKGRGKRGGVRVIYFNVSEEDVIYLITLYRKTEKENITANDIKQVR
jgi:mRNA-degrading endonuclease RelE of RelBE toxin-antitoxin system